MIWRQYRHTPCAIRRLTYAEHFTSVLQTVAGMQITICRHKQADTCALVLHNVILLNIIPLPTVEFFCCAVQRVGNSGKAIAETHIMGKTCLIGVHGPCGNISGSHCIAITLTACGFPLNHDTIFNDQTIRNMVCFIKERVHFSPFRLHIRFRETAHINEPFQNTVQNMRARRSNRHIALIA